MLSKPGLVISVHDKDKSEVEVQCDSEVIKAHNMLSNIKVGDYVLVLNDVVIEIISERQAKLKF